MLSTAVHSGFRASPRLTKRPALSYGRYRSGDIPSASIFPQASLFIASHNALNFKSSAQLRSPFGLQSYPCNAEAQISTAPLHEENHVYNTNRISLACPLSRPPYCERAPSRDRGPKSLNTRFTSKNEVKWTISGVLGNIFALFFILPLNYNFLRLAIMLSHKPATFPDHNYRLPDQVGSEGAVYLLNLDTVAKERFGALQGNVLRLDNLAELKRSLVHSFVGSVATGGVTWTQKDGTVSGNLMVNCTAHLIEINQVGVSGWASWSVMPRVYGRAIRDAAREDLKVYENFQRYGVEVDIRGDNLFELSDSGLQDKKIAVLEALMGVHPESLKALGNVSGSAREAGMRTLAWLDLLGETHMTPTLPRHAVKHQLDGFWLDRCRAHAYGKGEQPHNQLAIDQARDYFGKQFKPQMFDWRTGENCHNFGISQALFTEFSGIRNEEVTRVREVERLAQTARANTRPIDPERVLSDLRARLKARDAQFPTFS